MFDTTVRRLGFADRDADQFTDSSPSRFRRPPRGGQLSLF
jgi:hypothetical protein